MWLINLLILAGTVVQGAAVYRYRCFHRELHAWFFTAGFIGLFCPPLMMVMLLNSVATLDIFNPDSGGSLIAILTIWVICLLFAAVGLFQAAQVPAQGQPQAQIPAQPQPTEPPTTAE